MKKHQLYFGVMVALFVCIGNGTTIANSQQRRIDPVPCVQDAPGEIKKLYFSSSDFPPNVWVQYPARPEDETQFWQMLDKELAGTRHFSLTNNLEEADYRVELHCSGVYNCSELSVDIKDPNRNLLGSFSLKHFAQFGGIGAPNLLQVSHDLASALDDRIQHFPQGGYGYTK